MPAWADDLIAIKPGLLCVSSAALAKLTLPDGSSRTAQSEPSPADLALKQSGKCIDITIGMRVSLVTARHNTSIVTYSLARGQPQIYVVPNIDFQAAQAGAPPLSSVDDTAADNTIDQVVTAPGGTTNYYILTLSGQDAEGVPNREIQATYDENASHVVLLKNQPSGDPSQNLTGFSNLLLSPDNKTLYFQAEAWATSDAVHSIDIATKKVSYVAPGEIACVVLTGEFQGDLIIQQHRYFVQGGSYDNLWLFDPTGKELGLVSENTDASKVCPTLSD
jgi:hypothetical protein